MAGETELLKKDMSLYFSHTPMFIAIPMRNEIGRSNLTNLFAYYHRQCRKHTFVGVTPVLVSCLYQCCERNRSLKKERFLSRPGFPATFDHSDAVFLYFYFNPKSPISWIKIYCPI